MTEVLLFIPILQMRKLRLREVKDHSHRLTLRRGRARGPADSKARDMNLSLHVLPLPRGERGESKTVAEPRPWASSPLLFFLYNFSPLTRKV